MSATEGTGLEALPAFFEHGNEPRQTAILPIFQDLPHCRKWAAQAVRQAAYRAPLPPTWTRRLDDIVLHKFWGPLVFIGVVGAVFQSVFGLGQPLSKNLLAESSRGIRTKIGPAHLEQFLPFSSA